jgi:RNA recognition motif-containing protein
MSKELYVGSLSYETTEYDLEKLFSVSGRVTSVHLIVDLTTGEFKGCGYVRMSTEAEAKDAIDSLDGAMLIDRKITVALARAQKMKASGGGLRGRFKGKPGGSDNDGSSAVAAKPVASKKTTDYKAGAAKAAAARPGTARPAAARPATDRPASARPSSAKPASARPTSSKSGTSRSPAAKPAGSQTRTPRTGKR